MAAAQQHGRGTATGCCASVRVVQQRHDAGSREADAVPICPDPDTLQVQLSTYAALRSCPHALQRLCATVRLGCQRHCAGLYLLAASAALADLPLLFCVSETCAGVLKENKTFLTPVFCN
ncbi:unnamed protein product [Miscanthus lutarioriparius]|uniref:Uncharacterized protein n=1 Tax=Miscanthus lutarioriparius TaxID=422564 RepID=A0A811QBT3_9POAL|nr:unnamed protein product [Miscanthus lutarioriparius]